MRLRRGQRVRTALASRHGVRLWNVASPVRRAPGHHADHRYLHEAQHDQCWGAGRVGRHGDHAMKWVALATIRNEATACRDED